MRASSWAFGTILLAAGCADGDVERTLDPPRAFRADPADGTVVLSWERADARGVETAIVRWSGARVTDLPEGAELTVGRAFEGAVVLYVGREERFVDTALDRCEPYFYGAFTVGRRGLRSEIASAPSLVGGASVAPVASAPGALDATLESSGIRVRWGAPPTPADHVRVVRRAGAAVEGPTDGDVIANETTALELFDPIDASAFASGLAPATTYHYAAFACDACGRCETVGTHASASTPVALGDAPTDLTVEPDGATVRFRWSGPDLGGAATWRLMARVGAPVEGPDDPLASVLHQGPDREARVASGTFLPEVAPWGAHHHFAVFACVGDRCGEGAAADRGFTLRESLRGGGYVVYFTHGAAGVCADHTELGTAAETSVPGWWESCERACDVATAEQLSDEGRDDAELAGRALREGGIPFDRVLSSEYCRAVETAEELALVASADLATRPELTPFVHGDDDDRCRATLDLLAGVALATPDHNAAIVGHGGLPSACAALDDLGPAEAAIFRPTAEGPRLVARVTPEGWGELP